MSFVKIEAVLSGMLPAERKISGHCEIHGDWERTAFFIGETQVSGFGCPTCQAEREEKERVIAAKLAEEEAVKAKREHYENCLSRSGLPGDFVNKTFANFKPVSSCQANAKQIAEKYVASFYTKVAPNGYGLLFYGQCGTGKSHLACSIIHALLPKTVGVYVRVPDIISSIRSHWGNRDSVSEYAAIQEYIKQDLLVVDEIGVQAGSDNERNILFQIVDARISENRPTIFITNLKLDELAKFLGERLVDRIKSKCVPVLFTGQSMRKTLKASAFD